jgi:hypothetical protein
VTNVSDSILTSTKKVLGMDESYTAFDVDIILHINGAFNTLQDIGLGPQDGFMIESKETVWDDFIGDELRLNSVKNYVYLFVRLAFDPPATSFAIASMEKQLEECLARLSIHREANEWAEPITTIYQPSGMLVDGGDADG